MALIKTIRDLVNKKIAKMGCKKYGHCGIKTLEVYHTVTQEKNFLLFGGKFILVPPYKQYRISGKRRCTACGTIFIGIIVKEEQFHDNRQDA